MCLALLISLYHDAMVAEPTSVLALGLFYRVCISGRCGGTVPGSCGDIYRIFLGWFWFGKASGIWEQACLMWCSMVARSFVESTDPACMPRYGKL
jgi:hypothetical protein